ncbi:hypothetical protein [Pectobacterium versatile]|uniref:hypothetical protein n=1 Tax=Pectobacterium versatile TaxID=2488639 RepID=UPI002B24A85C|nr:hypothetical protein [Pectobacterium versatile]
MLKEINNLFKKYLAPSSQFSPSSKAGTLFEVWICLRIADELNQRGMKPLLYQEGNPPQQITANPSNRVQSITFKSSPGKIGSGNGCFIVFDWGTAQHEIQISIEYEGRSGSLHEIDVSIIPSLIANDIRTNNHTCTGYPFGAPKLAIECKDKKNKGSKDEARNFLARLYDIHLLAGHPVTGGGMGVISRIYSSRNIGVDYGARHYTYKKSFSESYNVMCHSGRVVPEAIRYLYFFQVNTHQQLIPGSNNANNFIKEVVDYISNNTPT